MSNIPDKELRELNENLVRLNKRFGSLWIALGKGFIGGLGSVLGAGIAIILIGWFLNVIGVIPAFQKQAEQWREVFDQSSQSIITPSGSTGVTE
jgi:hypothetical protein